MTLRVTILVDGERVEADPNATLGAVLHARGLVTRRSVTGRPRGLYCGMGACFECEVDVDGRPVRACLTPVAPDMCVVTGRGGA